MLRCAQHDSMVMPQRVVMGKFLGCCLLAARAHIPISLQPPHPGDLHDLVRRLGDGYGCKSNRVLTACDLYFLYGWDDFGGEDVERFQVVDVGHAEDSLVYAHGCKACEMLDGGSRGH
jgi:hypothetical protein